MLDLAKSFSEFNGEDFNKWIIGKAELMTLSKKAVLNYRARIEKKSSRFAVLLSEALDKDKNIIKQLKIYLLKLTPCEKEIHGLDKNINFKNLSYHFFTKEDIRKFLSIVNDTNEIHRTINPIVPGLQIFNYILNNIPDINEFHNLKIKFFSPIYANEKFYISINSNEIIGFTKLKLLFKVKGD